MFVIVALNQRSPAERKGKAQNKDNQKGLIPREKCQPLFVLFEKVLPDSNIF